MDTAALWDTLRAESKQEAALEEVISEQVLDWRCEGCRQAVVPQARPQ